MLPKPKSIDDYGGIKPYLNAPEIRALHNGLGYTDFKYRNRKRKHPQSILSRAEDFGVSKTTYYDWIKRDEAAPTTTGRGKYLAGTGPAASSARPGGAGAGDTAATAGDPE